VRRFFSILFCFPQQKLDIPKDWTNDNPEAGDLYSINDYVRLAETITEGIDRKEIKVSWDCFYGTCETKVEILK
jgi:hypothetical protein